MEDDPNVFILSTPSAWGPIVMSLLSIIFIFVYIMIFGITESREGENLVRIFQLIIFLQALVVGYFTIKWMPKQPKQTLIVLLIQLLTASLPVIILFIIERGIRGL